MYNDIDVSIAEIERSKRKWEDENHLPEIYRS